MSFMRSWDSCVRLVRSMWAGMTACFESRSASILTNSLLVPVGSCDSRAQSAVRDWT